MHPIQMSYAHPTSVQIIGCNYMSRWPAQLLTPICMDYQQATTERHPSFLTLVHTVCVCVCACACAHAQIGEMGDCDPQDHTPVLVSEFRFSPKQSETIEADIF